MAGNIRFLYKDDLKEVLKIEKTCFLNPWTKKDFFGTLQWKGVFGKVAIAIDLLSHEHVVVGFVLFAKKVKSIRVIKIGVKPIYREVGLGGSLINSLKSSINRNKNRTCITTFVPEENLNGQLFFKAMSFIAVNIVKADGETFYKMVYNKERTPINNRIAKYFHEKKED